MNYVSAQACINKEIFCAALAVVGRICVRGWNRVTVSKNLGVIAVAPVTHVVKSLNYYYRGP